MDDAAEPTAAPETSRPWRERLAQWPAACLHWSGASRGRKLFAGAAAVGMVASMFAAWSYLARLAVEQSERPSLARALFAYDEGRYEDARAIVGSMQDDDRAEVFGGALFVLGAVKAAEADASRSEDRRSSLHLLAARYLQKARELGVPDARDQQLRLLLGKSLVLGQQGRRGIPVLLEYLAEGGDDAEANGLLVQAYLDLPAPNYGAALEHVGEVLASSQLTAEQRGAAELDKVDILLRLGRLAEARAALPADDGSPGGPRALLEGRLALAESGREPPGSDARLKLLDAAEQHFVQAEAADVLGGSLTRAATFWLGRLHELRGKVYQAQEQFDRLSKLYADTPEGLAGELAKARLEKDAGNFDRALSGYRVVLESIRVPEQYVNPFAPLAVVRKQVARTLQEMLADEHFAEAETLAEHLYPTFSEAEQTEMRARLHERWGNALLKRATAHSPWPDSQVMREGRRHLRIAGRDFEDLARLRFSDRSFPDNLWQASENYFLGQSFTSAARTIEEYLRHEVRRLGATALLRLGQCRLAGNRPDLAIDAFEECVASFPRDAIVYQARLECARARLMRSEYAAAESLLRTNLTGDTLDPQSLEWRDSLFELGRLLYEAGRYTDAIITLEEAIARYPESDQALLARYTVARANHVAAAEPAALLSAAKTENERQKNRTLLNGFLNDALDAYLAVQRIITLEGPGEATSLHRALMRNCYMMQGAVLYELRRWEDAKQAFSAVSTHYQNDPFVLESYVQIANCWRRLNQPLKARQTIIQAQKALERIPQNADFRVASNFSRQQWQFILDRMYEW